MKLSKILSVIAIIAMVLIISSNFIYAKDPSQIVISTDNTTDITTMGGKVIGVIQVIGSVIAVAILVVLGIKYMLGSTEEKAEYKKTLVPYLIGAILIFAASNIAGAVYNAVQGM